MSEFNKELIAVIEPDGRYMLDIQHSEKIVEDSDLELIQNMYKEYLEDSRRFLFEFGADKKAFNLSESMEYLYKVASTFVHRLSNNPHIEMLRENTKAILEEEDRDALLKSVPYIKGAEHVDEHWLNCTWDRLNEAFSKEISSHKGSVAEYFTSRNPSIHFAGRVYFHLVESKKGSYPFAFLATYASEQMDSGKVKHLPLKNALVKYGENSKKLLELLSTVNIAAHKSTFIADIVNTGEIFHPIGLNPDEAYVFLKEVPLYEESGIL